jgi:hypothetical protein
MAVCPSVLVSLVFCSAGPGNRVLQDSNFVNKQPHRLHCFYGKQSTFVHGEEGEEVAPALGQQVGHILDEYGGVG